MISNDVTVEVDDRALVRLLRNALLFVAGDHTLSVIDAVHLTFEGKCITARATNRYVAYRETLDLDADTAPVKTPQVLLLAADDVRAVVALLALSRRRAPRGVPTVCRLTLQAGVMEVRGGVGYSGPLTAEVTGIERPEKYPEVDRLFADAVAQPLVATAVTLAPRYLALLTKVAVPVEPRLTFATKGALKPVVVTWHGHPGTQAMIMPIRNGTEDTN